MELEKGGMALGVMGQVAIEDHRVCLDPGDILLMYTDGVTDTINPSEKDFGDQRLRETASEKGAKRARRWLDIIDRRLEEWSQGASPADDVTMIAVGRARAAGRNSADGKSR